MNAGKWLVFWDDGDVSVWSARDWSAAAVLELLHAVDVVFCPAGVSPVAAAMWWREDAA